MRTLDHVQVEPELEIQEDAVVHKCQVSRSAFFYQDKPRCIPPIIFDFSFNHYLYIKIDCALSLLDLVETVVTL
jgi:hypothetical protein